MEGNSEDFRALAQEVLEEFGALGRRMGSRMQNARRGEHGVIHALACSASPLTPSELATLGHLSSARVANVLRSLEEKGLVTREHSQADRRRVTVDVEGYRAKREETLRALARRMAAKALRNQRSVMLEPMNPYERRIIHSEVQNIEGVSTNSVGSDTNRKVVIYLVKKAKADDAADNVSETETAETDNA